MYLNNTRYYYWLIIYFKVKHVILFNYKGLQQARGLARAHFWMGRATTPNLGPARPARGPARRPAT